MAREGWAGWECTGSSAWWGLVFATRLLPRRGPCLQPPPGPPVTSRRVEVMREAAQVIHFTVT